MATATWCECKERNMRSQHENYAITKNSTLLSYVFNIQQTGARVHTHTNRNRHIHYILLCANSSSRHIYTLKGKIGWFMYSWRCFEINWLSCQLCYILVSINNFGSIVMEKKGMRCVFVQFVHDGCYIRQHKEVSWKYIHMIATAAAVAVVAVAQNKIRKEKVRKWEENWMTFSTNQSVFVAY